MKIRSHITVGLLAVGSALLLSVGSDGLAAEPSINSKPPTGLYVSVTGISPNLIVRLGANGDYEVRPNSRAAIGNQSQHGYWKWDARRKEFLLSPMDNPVSFPYEFRRLRVDPNQSDTLQWIPLQSGAPVGAGVIDYVRFKREKEWL